MSSKRVAVDYGDRKIDIEVPESAFIAEYHEGTLIENPREAVLNALSNPLGMPPLTSLAKPGMKVAIDLMTSLGPIYLPERYCRYW